MTFVLLQLLLRQREYLFAHQCLNRNLNPLLARPFMTSTIATRPSFPLAQGAGDPLSGTRLGFTVAGGPAIGRVAQHSPNRRSFPAPLPRARSDLAFIQQTSDRVDTEALLCIDLKHHPHHSGLAFDHFVESRRRIALLHVPVAVRRSGKYVHSSTMGHVPFPTPAPLRDLRSFVFGNHALKLHQHLVLLLAIRGDPHVNGSWFVYRLSA